MIDQVHASPTYEVPLSLAGSAYDGGTGDRRSSTHASAVGGTGDTVTLSARAQESTLYLEGESVTQIAARLDLPASAIDSDLNITPDSGAGAQSVHPGSGETLPKRNTPLSTPITAALGSQAYPISRYGAAQRRIA